MTKLAVLLALPVLCSLLLLLATPQSALEYWSRPICLAQAPAGWLGFAGLHPCSCQQIEGTEQLLGL
jgi:hypothetical protein